MAANERITDIRVQLSLPTNRKVMRLERELGGAACWCLIKLWIYCASNEPDGCLAGWTEDDIEGVSGWGGMRGAFAAHAERIGLLDRTTGGFEVHDWTENQSWIAKANERTIAARTAARTRWSKLKSCDPHAECMQGACESNAALMPPSIPTIPTVPTIPTNQPIAHVGFAEFWAIYPRRDGKAPAMKAWAKVLPIDHPAIMAAVKRQAESDQWRKDGGAYIPMPATWLNQRRWEDEGITVRPTKESNPMFDGAI